MENNVKVAELKTVKTSFSNEAVMSNLKLAIEQAKLICIQREYVVLGEFGNILSDINLNNSTLSSRKKLARKIYFFMKKKTLRTMTAMLSIVRKNYLTDEHRVTIKPSLNEQEIVILREKYKKLHQETELVRLELKEKKKLFNELKKSYDN